MSETDTDLVMRIIGRKILAKRKSLHMTQQDLSEKVDLTRASITNFERGIQNIQLKTLVKLADAFNCDISDLLPRIR